MTHKYKKTRGKKYIAFKFRIGAILSEIEVIKVIESETPDPDDLTDEWIKSERIAKSMPVEHLAELISQICKKSTAKEILQNLDTIFECKSTATQLALRKKNY